jgi:hypothetical protein
MMRWGWFLCRVLGLHHFTVGTSTPHVWKCSRCSATMGGYP